MKDVLRIDIPKERLLAMPASARSEFLLLGYASNQMAFYTKLMILSVNHRPDDKIETPCPRARP